MEMSENGGICPYTGTLVGCPFKMATVIIGSHGSHPNNSLKNEKGRGQNGRHIKRVDLRLHFYIRQRRENR